MSRRSSRIIVRHAARLSGDRSVVIESMLLAASGASQPAIALSVAAETAPTACAAGGPNSSGERAIELTARAEPAPVLNDLAVDYSPHLDMVNDHFATSRCHAKDLADMAYSAA